MGKAVEEMKEAGEDIEKYWEIVKNGMLDVLHEGRVEAKRISRKNRKKGGRIGMIEKELKRLKEERRKIAERMKEGGSEKECVRQMKAIKNKIDKKRKARRVNESLLSEKRHKEILEQAEGGGRMV